MFVCMVELKVERKGPKYSFSTLGKSSLTVKIQAATDICSFKTQWYLSHEKEKCFSRDQKLGIGVIGEILILK